MQKTIEEGLLYATLSQFKREMAVIKITFHPLEDIKKGYESAHIFQMHPMIFPYSSNDSFKMTNIIPYILHNFTAGLLIFFRYTSIVEN
jgi:hypothetical protein